MCEIFGSNVEVSILGGFHKLMLIIRSIPNTIYFNLKYLPLKDAMKLPVIVSHRCILSKMAGSVVIKGCIKFNMIHIGFHENYIFDQKNNRAVWHNNGTIVFNGTAYFGNGSCLANFGTVTFGDNFQMSGNSKIICKHDIQFGDNVLIGWNCTFMDSDAHKVYLINASGDKIRHNYNRPILVGDHVWFGINCLILKGVCIPDQCVVAANSCVTKSFTDSGSIIGGYPAKVLKREIFWEG